jgi:hypothetical protein
LDLNPDDIFKLFEKIQKQFEDHKHFECRDLHWLPPIVRHTSGLHRRGACGEELRNFFSSDVPHNEPAFEINGT